MRVWDISPKKLCRQHLLGEHRELHAIWSIIVNNKKGYAKHPETLRWKGKLRALFKRHQKLAFEITQRGYQHRSPLDEQFATGCAEQRVFVDSLKQQRQLLRKKGCSCDV